MSRVAVIGGGVAGLTAARTLLDEGQDIVVFDKGRRAAGRISTRRDVRFDFDHGAQYFTARDADFAARVRELADQRVVAPWEGRIVALDSSGEREVSPRERWVGVPGMSALARALAEGLLVEASTRIVALVPAGTGWSAHDERGCEFGPFDAVVLALPAPQAADLIEEHSSLGALARGVKATPCWAILLGFAERYEVPFDGAFMGAFMGESALAWAARNSSKPGRPAGEAWVLHASAEWSQENLFAEPVDVRVRLTHELATRSGVALPRAVHVDAHRWRFARAADVEPGPGFHLDRERGLVLCGDWCAGERVEGAWLSGRAAGRALADELLAGGRSAPRPAR